MTFGSKYYVGEDCKMAVMSLLFALNTLKRLNTLTLTKEKLKMVVKRR